MREPPQIRLLPDGRRLHMHDGPIDLIVEACGAPELISAAYKAASLRFVTVLDGLCGELTLLRQPVGFVAPTFRSASCFSSTCRPEGRRYGELRQGTSSCHGTVARRMMAAVMPYAERTFITPMAAVAGAVAEEILETMTRAAQLDRAYVNDGGDIALHLMAGEQFVVGMVERPDRPSLFGTATLDSAQPARGIATSGWRGRSFSLGVADAVTVLAPTASMADAAATIIANAIDLPGHPAVVRMPAREIDPDSDLGDRLVTCDVGTLDAREVARALEAGVNMANSLLTAGLICAAALCLQGKTCISGIPALLEKVLNPSDRSLVNA